MNWFFRSDAEIWAYNNKLHLVLGLVFAILSLTAIWAVLARGHWFYRAAIAIGFPALLLPTRAYELVVMVVIHTVTVTVAVWLARYFTGRRNRKAEGRQEPPAIQFGVRDLLLFTAVAAAIMAIVVFCSSRFNFSFYFEGKVQWAWFAIGLGALGLSCSGLAAAWLIFGSRPFWLRVILLPLPVAASALAMRYCGLWPSLEIAITNMNAANISEIKYYFFSMSIASLLLLSCFFLARCSRKLNKQTSKCAQVLLHCRWRLAARFVLVLLLVAMAIPGGFLYWWMARPLGSIDLTLPESNGYEQLVKVGEQFSNLPNPDNSVNSPPAAYVAFAKQHEKQFTEAHAALKLPCKSKVSLSLDATLNDIQSLRTLAQAISAAVKGKKISGKLNDAVEYSLDCMRLGSQTSRGGLLIDWLCASAIEGVGEWHLRDMYDDLSVAQCRRIIAAMLQMQNNRELLDVVLQRDETWYRTVYGWQHDFIQGVEILIAEHNTMTEQTSRLGDRRHKAERRLLVVELAIKAYRLEQGELPDRLDDLIPEYLPTVLTDPYTEEKAPLIYRRTDDGHLLYSVGPNGRDDGGQKVYWSEVRGGQGDMFFDTRDLDDPDF